MQAQAPLAESAEAEIESHESEAFTGKAVSEPTTAWKSPEFPEEHAHSLVKPQQKH